MFQKIVLALALTVSAFEAHAQLRPPVTGGLVATYGLHLYFNEKEFVDVIELRNGGHLGLVGTMIVPDDFTAPLTDLRLSSEGMSFDVLVPRNAARPKDLVFHYEAKFFDRTANQASGFVTIKGQLGFVASFVLFRRPNP